MFGILLSKWTGDQWTLPRVVVNVHKRAAGNPKLFIVPTVSSADAPSIMGPGARGVICGAPLCGETWTDLSSCQRPGILGKNSNSAAVIWLIR